MNADSRGLGPGLSLDFKAFQPLRPPPGSFPHFSPFFFFASFFSSSSTLTATVSTLSFFFFFLPSVGGGETTVVRMGTAPWLSAPSRPPRHAFSDLLYSRWRACARLCVTASVHMCGHVHRDQRLMMHVFLDYLIFLRGLEITSLARRKPVSIRSP